MRFSKKFKEQIKESIKNPLNNSMNSIFDFLGKYNIPNKIQKFWKINNDNSIEIFPQVMIKVLEKYIGKNYEFDNNENTLYIFPKGDFEIDSEEYFEEVEKCTNKLLFLENYLEIVFVESGDEINIGFTTNNLYINSNSINSNDEEFIISEKLYNEIIDYINGYTDKKPNIENKTTITIS